MIPHLIWLKEVDFVPLTYAGDVYGLSSRAQSAQLVLGYVGHNLALLAVPVVLARPGAAVAAGRRLSRVWSRGANPGVNLSQALNIWIIQIIVAVGPPLGGLVFTIYMKTDWGISLFFLVPLALVAIPALADPATRAVPHRRDLARAHARDARRRALDRRCARWRPIPTTRSSYGARSQLARELTEAWHTRFRLALGRRRRHHGGRRAPDVLQPRSSGAVHAGRSLVIRADLARGSQAARLHRRLRHRRMGVCRRARPG